VHLLTGKHVWPIKIGLFIVVLFWFTYTVYQLIDILHGGIEVPFTDVPATLGLSLRTVASLIALITAGLYMIKHNFSSMNVLYYFRWVAVFEATYWLSFLPSGIWGFQYSTILYSQEFFILSIGIPCLLEAILLPSILFILALHIGAKRPEQATVKWLLITVVAYFFVFWFNYTVQWWSEIFVSGTSLIWTSRLYAFEFILTIGGLLLLTIYSGIFTKNSIGADSVEKLNLQKVGASITAFGIYFDLLLLLWILFPNLGDALTVWPTISVEHNPDLWMFSLPFIGLPLMFYKNKKINAANKNNLA
jgi:uncharacterized membrane protein YphA (DoxX/SURF4 family)